LALLDLPTSVARTTADFLAEFVAGRTILRWDRDQIRRGQQRDLDGHGSRKLASASRSVIL